MLRHDPEWLYNSVMHRRVAGTGVDELINVEWAERISCIT